MYYLIVDDQNRVTQVVHENNAPIGSLPLDDAWRDRFFSPYTEYPAPLKSDAGVLMYKVENGIIQERTKEEIEQELKPTLEQRVTALEEKVDVEMADQQEALRILGL